MRLLGGAVYACVKLICGRCVALSSVACNRRTVRRRMP